MRKTLIPPQHRRPAAAFASARSNGRRVSTFWLRIAAALGVSLLAACGPREAPSAPPAAAPAETRWRVYFLGGQSNMEGFGFVADLPADQRGPIPGVMIFDGRMVPDNEAGGGVGVWAPLAPGHGTGFATDGRENRLSDRFGPELAFGRRRAELSPGERIAIIKYARGGSALAAGVSGYGSWEPDYAEGNQRNQYDNALSAIAAALAVDDIDGDGVRDRLQPAGIVWMQGEADAYDNAAAAHAYEANLRRMMDLLRAALRQDDLPVVIGRIRDSGQDADGLLMDYSAQVRAAQSAWTTADRCAALVTASDDFGFLPDGWHYQSADYLTLGNTFAQAMHVLEDRCGARNTAD
jgi:hypothetical protein